MVMKLFKASLVVLFVLAGAFNVQAQGLVNATAATVVTFEPSTDHAKLSSYEFGYFASGATDPIQSAQVSLAELTAVGPEYKFAFPRLLFGGPFTHKLRACAVAWPGGAACSPWVLSATQTTVSPFSPSAVVIVPE